MELSHQYTDTDPTTPGNYILEFQVKDDEGSWSDSALGSLTVEVPQFSADYDGNSEVGLGDLNLVLFNWNVDGADLTSDWINQRPVAGTIVGLNQLNGVLFNWGSIVVDPPPLVVDTTADEQDGNHGPGDLSLREANSAIVGNHADESVGGIMNLGIGLITNSTLTGNSVSNNLQGAVYNGDTLTVHNSITALNDNLTDIENNPLTPESDFYLIGSDPGFVRDASPGVDAIWGTADDDYGDLRLTPGSPAIDSGSNALAVDEAGIPLANDLAGNERITNGTVDIGGYEYQGMPFVIASSLQVESNRLCTVQSHSVPATARQISTITMSTSSDLNNGNEFIGPSIVASGGLFNTRVPRAAGHASLVVEAEAPALLLAVDAAYSDSTAASMPPSAWSTPNKSITRTSIRIGNQT